MPPKKPTTVKKTAKPAPVAPVVEEPVVPITFVDTVRDEDDVDFEAPAFAEEQVVGGKEKYYESVGRRKQAIARVRLLTRKSTDAALEDAALMTVNDKDYRQYFTDAMLQTRVESPLRRLKSLSRFKVTVRVSGGGISGQADAVRHGISRSLEQFDANFRKRLKKAGFLTRDPRQVQRKMPGLKKARKAGRWSKR
jgi:small subunit ribosomal protein S9